MTGGKFSNGGWSWNEIDSLHVLGLTGSKFSDMARTGVKLTVFMLLA